MNVILTVEQGEQMISPMLKSLADVGLGDAVALPTTPRERRIFAEIVRETVLEFEESRKAASRRPRVVKPPVVGVAPEVLVGTTTPVDETQWLASRTAVVDKMPVTGTCNTDMISASKQDAMDILYKDMFQGTKIDGSAMKPPAVEALSSAYGDRSRLGRSNVLNGSQEDAVEVAPNANPTL